MEVIKVENLKKYYKVFEKEPGFFGSMKSLFNRKYKDVKAVDDIGFNINEGELVGFIGPNGAGKTTTLKCLSGLLYPASGKVSVLNFTPWERKTKFLKQIALVMGQKNQLWWDLPAMETFTLNKEIYEIPDSLFKKNLDELIGLLEIENVLNIQVKRLSLGQRMKCELIAALIHQPKVLFLDEPTIGLDVVMQKKLREFIKEYNRQYNSTVILTSHYMRDVEALCKRVIIINYGKILFDGLLSDLIKKHAPYKLIKIVLKEKIDKEKVQDFGDLRMFKYPQVVLRVMNENSGEITAKILKNLPVEDLNIEDPEIEEVIREVFDKNHNEKILDSD